MPTDEEIEDMSLRRARCGREPDDEADFTHQWILVYDQEADFPYCPECIEAIRLEEGKVPIYDPNVVAVWAPAPRQGAQDPDAN